MRELAKSMLSFSWAASLYGAERMAQLVFFPARQPAGWLAGSLDDVTWSARRQLGDAFELAFQLGDDLQREWLERLSPRRGPRAWVEAAGELAAGSRALWRFVAAGEEGAALRRELRNKVEVYRLVTGVGETLGLPPEGAEVDLGRFVPKALALEPYPALWALEGLGHRYTVGALRRAAAPRGLLSSHDLPKTALLMLHLGLGLALADHVLDTLAPQAPAQDFRRAVERYVELCEANARAGFVDAALESLGLVARCFYPDLVPGLARATAEHAERHGGPLRGYFWHGVGRAIYFVPVNFLPGYGSIWHALEMLRREAPDAVAETNGINGVAYAAVLVNLSDPGVIESLLHHHGERLRGTAFAEGVASAVLMRRTTTPGDADLERFLSYRPHRGGDRLAELWRELVAAPCAEALAEGEAPHRKSTPAGEVYRALAVAAGGAR